MSNYGKGANYERKLMAQLERMGYKSFRSAGSHGPVDVIALDPVLGKIIFIQAKRKKLSPAEFNEALDKLNGIKTLKLLTPKYYIVTQPDYCGDTWTEV